MSYIVDIIIIAVFAFTVFASYKKGFFKSLFDLVGTLIAIIVARIASETLADTAFDMFIKEPAKLALTNSLGTVGTTDYAAQAEEAIASIPDSLNGVMGLIGIDKTALLDKIASSDFAQGNLVENIMANVITPVGTAVIQFVLFVIFAVVFSLILKVVVKALDFIIKKLPVIKSLNKGLGIVVGILRGILTVVIVSMALGVIVSFIGNEAFVEAVNSSVIVNSIQGFVTTMSGTVLN